MGSAAVAEPELVDRVITIVPVAVGLDHRAGRLAVQGWTETTDATVTDALSRFGGAEAFIITDIARDGLLSGPDLDGLRAAALVAPGRVIASGGVATLDDVTMLAALPGLHGVITGKALYEGRFDVAAAVARLSATSGERS